MIPEFDAEQISRAIDRNGLWKDLTKTIKTVVVVLGAISLSLIPTGAAGQETPPAEAAITVNDTTPPSFWTTPDEDMHLKVNAIGDASDVTAMLVDNTGLGSADVEGVDVTECSDIPERVTGIGERAWCLQIAGVQPGAALSGKVETDKAIVTLTISQRDHFLMKPLIVTAAGLLLAILSLWLTTNWLEPFTAARHLEAALAENDSKGSAGISGLRDWVSAQRATASDKTLYQIAKQVMRDGPEQAAVARAGLMSALSETQLERDHRIYKAGQQLANQELNAMTDFYDGLDPRTTHPSTDFMTTLLKPADGIVRRIQRAEDEISHLRNDSQRKGLTAQVTRVKSHFADVDAEAALAEVEESLDDLETNIGNAAEGRRRAAATTPADAAAGLPIEIHELTFKARRYANLFFAGAAMLSIWAISLLIAIFTVAATTYGSNLTFGTAADYWGLFGASLGSSSAVGLLAVLAIWNLKKPRE